MSSWITRARGAHVPVLALLAAVLAALSCSPKSVPTPPGDGVEGVDSPSQLIVYPDTPTIVKTYDDLAPPGPSPNDTVLATEEVYTLGSGALQGMIFDFTPAERFEVFRQEGSVFRRFKDFDLSPVKRVLHGGTEIYRFNDQSPAPPGLREYVARGVVAGVVGTKAPKTNHAQVQIAAVGELDYTGPTGIAPNFRPMSDSLLYLEWAPYPGAAGYWVHVYQFTDQGGDEVIASSVPAPIYAGVTRDYFLAFMPASVTRFIVGHPAPAGARIVTEPSPLSPRTILNNSQYIVRVSAVDANGQLLATVRESGTLVVFRSEESYRVFPLGGTIVQPRACGPLPLPPCPCGDPPLPPCPSSDGMAQTLPSSKLQYYPAGTFPGPRR